jgi:serine/threonine-protein kinase
LERGNPMRTGVFNVPPMRQLPKIRWQSKLSTTWLMAPLLDRNILFTGSGDGDLYAVNADNGEKLWSASGFGQLEATGAISGDSIVAGGYSKLVQALNRRTGAVLWTYHAANPVQASPFIVDDVVYVATDHKVSALELGSGKTIWETPTGTQDSFMVAPAYAHGVLYTTGGRGLFALDAKTGKQIWTTPASDQFTGLALSDTQIFVGNFDKSFRAYDRQTGKELWKFQGGNVFWSSPALLNNIVYTGNIDRNLYALDAATGNKLWSFQAAGSSPSDPVIAGDVVYFSDSAHEERRGTRRLYALDAHTGQELWHFEATSTFMPSPALGENKMYITSTGELIALE